MTGFAIFFSSEFGYQCILFIRSTEEESNSSTPLPFDLGLQTSLSLTSNSWNILYELYALFMKPSSIITLLDEHIMVRFKASIWCWANATFIYKHEDHPFSLMIIAAAIICMGYWPSVSSQKMNEVNIQPSWPNKLGQFSIFQLSIMHSVCPPNFA